MYIRLALPLVVVVALSCPASALAQAKNTWEGKQVMILKQNVRFSLTDKNGKVVDLGPLNQMIYLVLREQDGWLRVRQRGKEGWFAKADAVPLEDAIAHFTARINNNRNDDYALFARGSAWRAKGELDIALRDINEAIRINPNVAGWYYSRGMVYTERKEFDKALADDTEAIRLDPNNALYRAGRGIDYRDLKQYDKAVDDFSEAIRLEPGNPTYWNLRGDGFAALKKYEKALGDYTEAIRLGPQDPRYYRDRARVYETLKEYDKGVADYDRAIALEPKAAFLHNGRGWLRYLKRDHPAAVTDFTEAIRLSPSYALAFVNRGDAHLALKDYAKALADFDEAIRLSPKYRFAHESRAWLLATCPDDKVRDGQKAVASAKTALELGSGKDPYTLDTLAAAYAEAGQFEEAVRVQTQALEDAAYAKTNGDAARRRLELYKKNMPYRTGP